MSSVNASWSRLDEGPCGIKSSLQKLKLDQEDMETHGNTLDMSSHPDLIYRMKGSSIMRTHALPKTVEQQTTHTQQRVEWLQMQPSICIVSHSNNPKWRRAPVRDFPTLTLKRHLLWTNGRQTGGWWNCDGPPNSARRSRSVFLLLPGSPVITDDW